MPVTPLGFLPSEVSPQPVAHLNLTELPWADPLRAIIPLRGRPRGARPRTSTRPPLMGFSMTPRGHPLFAMPALQSVTEPPSGQHPFGTLPPSLGSGSSRCVLTRLCCVFRLSRGARTEAAFHGVWGPSALEVGAATCAGFASPDCAASSGFLNLLTLCSAFYPPGLVSCR
jgi:hypothetical protein